MLVYPEIDPIAIQFGPVSIAWYGIMYLLGFIAAFSLARIRVKQDWSPLSKDHIDDLIFYSVIGVILGGRFGYMLFYDSVHLISDPLSWLIALPQLWNGGMSFHGGLLGVLCALFIISKRTHQPFISVVDFVAPLVPIGLGLGRIGNFINGELWGRPTDSVIGFLVQGTPRHATQLCKALTTPRSSSCTVVAASPIPITPRNVSRYASASARKRGTAIQIVGNGCRVLHFFLMFSVEGDMAAVAVYHVRQNQKYWCRPLMLALLALPFLTLLSSSTAASGQLFSYWPRITYSSLPYPSPPPLP